MLDTLDGAPVPRAPATPRSIRAASNSLSSAPVVFPEGYEFIEWLGEGGMGLVAKARDIGLNRGVAIKLIRPEISDRASVRNAFVREAQAMARVRHRNVVEIYASGEVETVPYFAMELVVGNSLADWLERHRDQLLPIDVALGLLTQICAGVAAIHSAGAVHRDLKPGNVLVGADMRVAVTDLGLVQLDGQRSFTKGTMAGTPEYLAPELILHGFGHGGDDRPADVYALGIIAYELLTGHLPFEGFTPEEVLERQMIEEPAAPSSSRPELAAVFDTVVLGALAKDPAARPDATTFARTLGEARAGLAKSYAVSSKILLVVDDDAAFLAWAGGVLKAAFPEANIRTCFSGSEAMLEVRNARPSVIISDLDMPDMNGVELTATIRHDARYKAVPIVIVTGVGGSEDWRLLHSLGADDILLKPMRAAALVAAIKRALAPGAQTLMTTRSPAAPVRRTSA